MDNFKQLHDQQDNFIKKTFQDDKLIDQPIFDSFTSYMDQTNIKIKKYSYKQQKFIIFLLILLLLSVGLNVYLAVVKHTPITITNIFEKAETRQEISKEHDDNIIQNIVETDKDQNTLTSETVISENNTENVFENKVIVDTASTNTVIEESKEEKEPINTTLTPAIFTDVNTDEVEDFVDQFAIGINKIKLQDTNNLESNTLLLYIAQQYFTAQSSKVTSLNVDTTYASSVENFHKFLSEFTITDFSTVDYLKSYNNYIGYASRSNSYLYGKDYSVISKEKYKCNDVTITAKDDNTYTAEADVTRTYEGTNTTYKVTFSFKVNSNYKYQKYKLLSYKAKITSGPIDNVIHLVGN